MKTLMILLTSIITLTSFAEGQVNFRNNTLEECQEIAIQEGLKIFLFISTNETEATNQKLLNNPQVVNQLNKYFVCKRLDLEDDFAQNILQYQEIKNQSVGVFLEQELIVTEFIHMHESSDVFLRRIHQSLFYESSEKAMLESSFADGSISLDELGRLIEIKHEDNDEPIYESRTYLEQKYNVDLESNRIDQIAVFYQSSSIENLYNLEFLRKIEQINEINPELAFSKMVQLIQNVQDNAVSNRNRSKLQLEVNILYPAYLIVQVENQMSKEDFYDSFEQLMR